MIDLASLLAGFGTTVTLPGGSARRFANMDHAASTPPFAAVLERVLSFAPSYANVHRGRGWASLVSTRAFEEAREVVGRFIGAGPDQVIVFTRNTTESLNHVAARLPVPAGGVVISTLMEHHSNDLPWRRVAPVLRAGVDAAGRVDEGALLDLLLAHRGRIVALAVNGASNVTGLVNPVHRWAQWAHAAGAPIVVDAAQLAPHRRIDVRDAADPDHLDYVAFSAHKMYAPFGVGVLAGPRAAFETGDPWQSGGGTVDAVDEDSVAWAAAPDRSEAGTPCVIGAIALATAIGQLEAIGWSAIQAHEDGLSRAAVTGLGEIPGVEVFGAREQGEGDRLGVVSFNVSGVPHALAAAVLADEHGLGTRSGCFCAHPYVKALLDIGRDESRALARRIAQGDRRDLPGMVRASFGLASVAGDVERLLAGVSALASGNYADGYILDPATGEFTHPLEAAVA